MPGAQPRGIHEGTRAEYLTVLALSAYAQVVPVPRQEDYGTDFFAALTRRDARSLFVEDVFGVQVKNNTDRVTYWRVPSSCLLRIKTLT